MAGRVDSWEVLERIGTYAAGELFGEEARQEVERLALERTEMRRLADSYTPTDRHTVAAQHSFPPRREHNENIARVPRLLPRQRA